MGSRSHEHEQHRERGITYLGLVVTLGVTMLVVGGVTFGLGSRRTVDDESAKRHAETAAAAASMHEAETGKVPTAAELAEYEPSLEYEALEVGDEVAVQGKVYVRSHGDVAELAARSGDTCFWVQRSPVTTKYANGACDGDPASLVFRDHW
jgi:hypothetical protein